MIQENVELSKYSNYKIGGPARYFCLAPTLEDVKKAVLWAKEKNAKIFILGGGTNLLINDSGFDGLVIKVDIQQLTTNEQVVFVGAGVLMEDLLRFTIRKNLSGLEWAGGLPGTFGGAIRGNAGAFGGEIKDNILSVESLDIESVEVIKRNNSECRFNYRNSIFKERQGQEVVVSAEINLIKGDPEKIRSSIEEKIKFRKDHHPLEYPNTGSTFKNVDLKQVPQWVLEKLQPPIKKDPFPVVPTAYLISEAGLKGRREGDCMVSPKHPNFLVNLGHATAKDVRTLIEVVKSEIKNKFNITLEEEIQIV